MPTPPVVSTDNNNNGLPDGGSSGGGGAEDGVSIHITSDKSTAGKGAIATTVAALCTFATSGSAQLFCH